MATATCNTSIPPLYYSKIQNATLKQLRDELIVRGITQPAIVQPYNHDDIRAQLIQKLLNQPPPKPCVNTCPKNENGEPIFKNNIDDVICIGGNNLTCGSLTPIEKDIADAQRKANVLKHGPNYIGISKKQLYGEYINRTPGMTTFANKKLPSLKATNDASIACFKTYWCANK